MSVNRKPTVEEIINKHSAKIEKSINTSEEGQLVYSRTYSEFKKEMAPELSGYEKLCRTLGGKIKLKSSLKEQEAVKKYIDNIKCDGFSFYFVNRIIYLLSNFFVWRRIGIISTFLFCACYVFWIICILFFEWLSF
jgi:hypothetical protein